MSPRDALLLIVMSAAPGLLTAWLAGYAVRRFGPRWGWVDRPGGRKIHTRPMPTAGGLAIWLGLALPLACGTLLLAWERLPSLVPAFTHRHLAGLWMQSGRLWLLIGCGTALVLLGLIDDLRGLSWRLRLAVQTAVAAVTVALGWRMTVFLELPWLTAALSVLWIVTLINSFNMLDNMDGLSAGVAAIAAAVLAATALTTPNPLSHEPQLFIGGLLLLFCGALCGFLFHNRPPARLFMGDAGSYLIGYLLATISLGATFAGPSLPSYSILAPLCALAVPLYDTASVILIRLRQGRSPFVGDKSHFSHRLVDLGLTKPQAVLTIYLATAACGLGTLLLHRVDAVGAAIVLLLVAMMLFLVAILEAAGPRK